MAGEELGKLLSSLPPLVFELERRGGIISFSFCCCPTASVEERDDGHTESRMDRDTETTGQSDGL